MDELFSRAMYTSGVPFAAVTENEDWIQFFRKLRPVFKIPSRYMLSESSLDKEYNRIQTHVETNIDNSDNLSIQCDAWTNVR